MARSASPPSHGSPASSPVLGPSFLEREQLLQELFVEPHETVFLEEFPRADGAQGLTPRRVRQNNEELWKAAEKGRVEDLSDLLTRGWDAWLDSRSASPASSSGAPPPFEMASFGSTACSESRSSPACSLSVEIDSRSLHGRTALHIAASNGQADCVELLLWANADIDAQTDAGCTALHLASTRGYQKVVCALLSASCDASLQTRQGELALHLAAANGHTVVLSALLEQCDSDLLGVCDCYGQRPDGVCQDIETSALLRSVNLEGNNESVANSSLGSEGGVDSYARRTPYQPGSVLLRNSRRDDVSRLLRRTGTQPKEFADTSPAVCGADEGSCSIPSNKRATRRHRFSKLRADHAAAVGPDSFTLKAVLGKGSFGEVYQVVHRQSGQVYAMKVLRKSKVFGQNIVRYAITERNLLSYIKHPFIVGLHYAFQTPTCLVLIVQFCPGGNLSTLIQQTVGLKECTAQLYEAEILLAIEYLHERLVVYRDMKPENVVLDERDHAMLTDFGLSKEGVQGLQGTKSFCGSIAYLAPEILARRGHGTPVDLYGLGVLLYEMLIGRPPYHSHDRRILFRNIASASLHVPASVSRHAASLIHALMRREPAQRLGSQQTPDVRNHSFFSGLNFESVLRRENPVPFARNAFRERSSSLDAEADRGASKVPNPFKSKLQRALSSSEQDLAGWEFASCEPGERASQAFAQQLPKRCSSANPSGRRNSRRGSLGSLGDWRAFF